MVGESKTSLYVLDPGWFKRIIGTLLWMVDNCRFRSTYEGQITSAWKKLRRNMHAVKQKGMLSAVSLNYSFARIQEASSGLWVFVGSDIEY